MCLPKAELNTKNETKRPLQVGFVFGVQLDYSGRLKSVPPDAIKILRIFLLVGLSQDPKVERQSSFKSRLRRFSKSPENGFFDPKMVKMTLSEGQILTQNFDFRGHISTFLAENTSKSTSFKAKNNA